MAKTGVSVLVSVSELVVIWSNIVVVVSVSSVVVVVFVSGVDVVVVVVFVSEVVVEQQLWGFCKVAPVYKIISGLYLRKYLFLQPEP